MLLLARLIGLTSGDWQSAFPGLLGASRAGNTERQLRNVIQAKPRSNFLEHLLSLVCDNVVARELIHRTEIKYKNINHVGSWVFFDEGFQCVHCSSQLACIHGTNGEIIYSLYLSTDSSKDKKSEQ